MSLHQATYNNRLPAPRKKIFTQHKENTVSSLLVFAAARAKFKFCKVYIGCSANEVGCGVGRCVTNSKTKEGCRSMVVKVKC